MSEFIFPIKPLLVKGIHKYSLDISELFRDVKWKIEFLTKYKKDTRQKTGTYCKTQL